MRWRGLRGLPRIVWLLGLASLFNDVSSEAIFPLLTLYIAALGGGVRALGVIEGSADALASLVKVVAGRWSDRGPRRLLVVGGYALPALARAGIAAAGAPVHVLGARLVDRLGKGIRSGPRDALLADSAAQGDTGRAFGLQRSMDHLGAALGPLLASVLLASMSAMPLERSLRITFAIAAGLGLVAPLLLLRRLRDTPSPNPTASPTASPTSPSTLPPAFWRYLSIAALFALANSSDAFLIKKATDIGFSPATVPLLWFGHHVVKTLAGAPGGALSDRVPRAFVVAAGWGAYALSYYGFAIATERWHVGALFGFYALYHGLTEAAERAMVSDVSDRGARGRAFGWYHGVTGAAALPASLLTGWLWEARGSSVALATSASLALAATLAITVSGWWARRGGGEV
jgi:MFS family permease